MTVMKGEYDMKKRKFLSVVIMMALIITMFTPMSFAASKAKKTTVYKNVVKSGNTAFCSTLSGDLYRIDLKTRKAVKIKQKYYYAHDLKVHKGYVYYIASREDINSDSWDGYICRVNIKTGKVKKLAGISDCKSLRYAISKSKIYYVYKKDISSKKTRTYKKVMKLNGKSKKKSRYNVKVTRKPSNAAGYSHYIDYSEADYLGYGLVRTYLKTPAGKIFLVEMTADNPED